MPFYLGRLGALRQLRNPMKGLDASNQRLGATHRSLDGTTTVDTLGHKRTYKIQWDYLTHDDLAYVEALHLGLIDGPLRLIDPQRKNRLAAQTSSGGSRFRNPSGFTATHGTVTFTPGTSLPPDVFAAGAITWTIPAATGGRLTVGNTVTSRAPLIPSEQVTLSLYVAGDGLSARAVMVPFDAAGIAGPPVLGPAVVLSAVYQRLTVSLTPSLAQAGCAVGLEIPTDNPAGALATTGWQLEAAANASAWVPGSGCPVVVVESLVDTYPEYGYHAPTLTLLET